MGPFVFINYRRSDTNYIAVELQRSLAKKLGEAAVFLDQSTLNDGDPFPEKIDQALHAVQIVLALIGPQWLFAQDPENGKRRLDDPNDYVRREIELAFQRNKLVVPVRCDRDDFPEKAHLPLGSEMVRLCDLHEKCPPIRSKYLQDVAPVVDMVVREARKAGYLSKEAPEQGKPTESVLPLPGEFLKIALQEPAPYIGLNHFSTNQARLFFGRDRDIFECYQLLLDPGRRISLLFGQSGVGKSSLLFAGLFPRIEDKWTVHYHRRNKEDLSMRLEQILNDHPQGPKPHLFILDQVEEMYTDPLETTGEDRPKESENLARTLKWALQDRPSDRFVLGFRNEYYTQVRDVLVRFRLPFNEWYLKALDPDGIRQAITGVSEDRDLYRHFRLDFEAGLPDIILHSVLHNADSHIAPLLQIQLRKLWDAAKAQNAKQPYISKSLFDKIWKHTLSDLLDAQLDTLDPALLESGLVLDLLHGLTTAEATASSRLQHQILQLYHHVPAMETLLSDLTGRFLIHQLGGNDGLRIRLTHDSLAPLLRQRFHLSDTPGQRAWRIIESKRREQEPDFSEKDLDIIDAGRNGMPVIPAELEKAMKESREKYDRIRAEIRQKNHDIFAILESDARQGIVQVDHEPSVEKFRAAMNVEVPDSLKREKLAGGLRELAFFFAHGQNPALAREALDLLSRLEEPRELIVQGLEKCRTEQWTRPEAFDRLLKDIDPEEWQTLQHRYFPHPIHIEGGTFTMGGLEYQWTNPEHEVQLDPFHLGVTPVTFYQFGLYRFATGGRIGPHTPPWGRFGDHPVVLVRWYEAVEYANWLSAALSRTPYYHIDPENEDPNNRGSDFMKWTVTPQPGADGFRLPTDAEWEYAARGGPHRSPFVYSGSDDPEKVAWHEGNSREQTHPVSTLEPNRLGLRHMSGNVWEWCWDWFGMDYYQQCAEKGTVPNPTGPEQSEEGQLAGRVIRGGSWSNSHEACRAAYRDRLLAGARAYFVGFRLARY